jgi:phosphatidylinositol alpha-mannosyltransferase
MGVVIVGWGLRKALREAIREGFDVIHMHGPHASLPLRALRYSTSLNILTFHATKPKGKTDRLIAQYVKKYVQRIHGAIAVSYDALNTMKYFIPAEYTIIPNGIDTNRFSPEVKPLPQFDDGSLNILFVGRFEPRKGLKYLIQAFRKIKKKIPKVRLIVVGKGWFTRVNITEARKEDIFFEGFVSVEKLPQYYATADVFCSPATGRESFGIVLLEAMSSKKPVIASNIPGYRRVIKNGENGILVPPKNPKKLEEAITKILTDRELKEKLSSNARKEALKYSWSNITEKIENFYYEIAEKEGIKLN